MGQGLPDANPVPKCYPVWPEKQGRCLSMGLGARAPGFSSSVIQIRSCPNPGSRETGPTYSKPRAYLGNQGNQSPKPQETGPTCSSL